MYYIIYGIVIVYFDSQLHDIPKVECNLLASLEGILFSICYYFLRDILPPSSKYLLKWFVYWFTPVSDRYTPSTVSKCQIVVFRHGYAKSSTIQYVLIFFLHQMFWQVLNISDVSVLQETLSDISFIFRGLYYCRQSPTRYYHHYKKLNNIIYRHQKILNS